MEMSNSPTGTGKMNSSQVIGMSGGPSIKNQLDSLSMTVHEVVGRVELNGRSIINLEEDRDRLKQVIATQDDILNQRIIGECQNVREDTAHKFSLQIAENRRLSTQLAKALADIQRLTRICENLTTRAQILEANTGIN